MATVVRVKPPSPIRVVIVDDDAMVRTGLSMILGGDPEIAIVGEAVNGAEALAVVGRQTPDVVLMDIRMPVLDGLRATEEILRTANPPRVIVLTTFDTDDMVLQALRVGASGFLLKDTPPVRLVEAVTAVAAGDPMLSPTVTAQLIEAVRAREDTALDARADRDRARGRLARLTGRELEVAAAIGRGLSNAEIATNLHMSVATVKAHVGRVLSKVDADNRVQVAILVHDAG